MRKPFLLVMILLSVALVFAGVVLLLEHKEAEVASVAPDGVRRVTVEELHGQLQGANPPLVWEFRTSTSFAEGHVPGSRLLTIGEIPAAVADLDKRQAIVTLCA